MRDLAEAINPWFRTWVYFAAYTGIRWSEMLGLRRKDFDLLRRTVTVERQLLEVQSRFVGFGPPKSAAGRRTITLPDFLVTMLEEQMAERAQPGPDGLVFVNTAGNPQHAAGFNAYAWARAKRRAGLNGVRWHDLRHTAVALAIEQGAHAKAIQERMGHASVSVTLDRYGHLLPSLGERIAEGLDGAFQARLPPGGDGQESAHLGQPRSRTLSVTTKPGEEEVQVEIFPGISPRSEVRQALHRWNPGRCRHGGRRPGCQLRAGRSC